MSGIVSDAEERDIKIRNLETQLLRYQENETMFQALVGTAVGDIGDDFFNKIAQRLSDWLNAECVIIGQLVSENTVQGFPMYLDGEIIEGFTYQLKNTPCDLTSQKGYCVFRDDVAHFYPESKDIRNLNIRGYVGTALYNKENKPNGIISAMSRSPLKLPPQAEEILRIVGARVTAEIERKKTRIALETSEAELRKAISVKNQLFSIIAHDLRSPVNALLGMSDILLESIEKEDHQEVENFAKIIRNASFNTHELVQNLLHWSLSQSGNITYHPSWVSFKSIVERALSSVKTSASLKKISINQKVEPELELFVDAQMVEMILRNLISNAVKFSNEDNFIQIAARRDSDSVLIEIQDQGVGISEEDQQRILNPNSASSTKDTSMEGSGLGLVICREFVQFHKGKIGIQSQPGKGSIFSVRLPQPDNKK